MKKINIAKIAISFIFGAGVIGYFLMLFNFNNKIGALGALLLFGSIIVLNISKNKVSESQSENETMVKTENANKTQTDFPSPDPTIDHR